MIVAIDGPAGSGKSTVAKIAAYRLGFQYLDTGAMYRAVAWRALQEGIELTGGEPLERIARTETIEFGALGPGTVSIAGIDVTREIRTPAVDKAVSPVSACPGVRDALTEQQRAYGRGHDIVMEGRDIGTVVFPDADVKIFLTASLAVRAHRRSEQNIVRGSGDTDEAEILEKLVARDAYDSSRETAPLCRADDAIELDTSELSIDEVVERICAIVNGAREEARR
jgi:cytidylate kinase